MSAKRKEIIMYITTRNDSYLPHDLFRELFSDEGVLQMRSDIYLDGDEYAIDIELPGVKKEDVNIEYKNEYLTISVSLKETENNKKYMLRERKYVNSSRSYHIGEVDEKSIKANFENGVLAIRFPKDQSKVESSHRIEIK